MKKIERLDELWEYLKTRNEISTNNLLKKAKQFNTSKVTLRRDLHLLENMGFIKLSYGKILVISNKLDLQSINEDFIKIDDLSTLTDLALRATEVLTENDIIFVAGSRTNIEFVRNINVPVRYLVSNSIDIILQGTKNNFINQLYLMGGNFNKGTKTCSPVMKEHYFENFSFNKLFFSCDSVKNTNVYFNNLEELKFLQSIFSKANDKYLLIDSSKFYKSGLLVGFQTSDFNELITDYQSDYYDKE